ncbi:hypothetical protein [Streptomyces sp. NBC_00986]|uniref:hypothetical protein n=1 Tax=Streptomyces sp. NBC_00986 TaxID=2903702 RepID=UPI00386902AF|nr:hypothetical protein OG504_49430 [Streptomyces sp. NBC_00986]
MSSTGVLILVLWLVVVPGLVPLLLRSYHQAVRARLTCTSGVVTGYEDKSYSDDGGSYEVYRPTVRFVPETSEPVEVTSKVWSWTFPPEVGAEVSVLSRSDRSPADWLFVGDLASYDERTRKSRRVWISGGLMVPLLLLTVWFLAR